VLGNSMQQAGLSRLVLLAAILIVSIPFGHVSAETHLTIDDVRQLAVKFNRQYLSAREDVEIARADVKTAWADALPEVSFNGNYSRSFTVPSVFFVINGETTELQTGFKNSFGASVSVKQSLWKGGKVFTALQIARLYMGYSDAVSRQVEAEVVFGAEQLFYGAILARARLSVLHHALESDSANLDVVEKQFSQGVVSEFEVLRARVEKQNTLPQIIRAEAEVELAEKRLKSFLGIDLNERIKIVEDHFDTVLVRLPTLSVLIDSALSSRSEMSQAKKLSEITHRAIRIARAEYWPSFEAVGAYSWQSASDKFTLTGNESSSWTAGVVVSVPIFEGGRTRGDVSKRRAEYRQATLAEQQIRDNITLEVEEAYTNILQAKKALDIQGATIAAAKEGLKIAQLRYQSGVGTQLEVLSAQAALTQAREIEAEALYSFRIARAGLKKATTVNM